MNGLNVLQNMTNKRSKNTERDDILRGVDCLSVSEVIPFSIHVNDVKVT